MYVYNPIFMTHHGFPIKLFALPLSVVIWKMHKHVCSVPLIGLHFLQISLFQAYWTLKRVCAQRSVPGVSVRKLSRSLVVHPRIFVTRPPRWQNMRLFVRRCGGIRGNTRWLLAYSQNVFFSTPPGVLEITATDRVLSMNASAQTSALTPPEFRVEMKQRSGEVSFYLFGSFSIFKTKLKPFFNLSGLWMVNVCVCVCLCLSLWVGRGVCQCLLLFFRFSLLLISLSLNFIYCIILYVTCCLTQFNVKNSEFACN